MKLEEIVSEIGKLTIIYRETYKLLREESDMRFSSYICLKLEDLSRKINQLTGLLYSQHPEQYKDIVQKYLEE